LVTRPLRVALVDPSGYSRPYDHEVARALAGRGHEVTLWTSAFVHGDAPQPAGYAVREHFYRRSNAMRVGARLRPDYEGIDARPWSEEPYVRGLLPGFDLEFSRGESTIAAESPEALWDLLSASVPPLKAWLATLDDAGRESARAQYTELFDGGTAERFKRTAQGKVVRGVADHAQVLRFERRPKRFEVQPAHAGRGGFEG